MTTATPSPRREGDTLEIQGVPFKILIIFGEGHPHYGWALVENLITGACSITGAF